MCTSLICSSKNQLFFLLSNLLRALILSCTDIYTITSKLLAISGFSNFKNSQYILKIYCYFSIHAQKFLFLTFICINYLQSC